MLDWSILMPVKHRSKYRDFWSHATEWARKRVGICRGRALSKPQENTEELLSFIAVLYAPGPSTPGRLAEPRIPSGCRMAPRRAAREMPWKALGRIAFQNATGACPHRLLCWHPEEWYQCPGHCISWDARPWCPWGTVSLVCECWPEETQATTSSGDFVLVLECFVFAWF